MSRKYRGRPALFWDRTKGAMWLVPPGPGGIVQTDVNVPLGLIGASAEHFATLTRAERRRAHVYKCESCQGPVYTLLEYRAKVIKAYCPPCAESQFPELNKSKEGSR